MSDIVALTAFIDSVSGDFRGPGQKPFSVTHDRAAEMLANGIVRRAVAEDYASSQAEKVVPAYENKMAATYRKRGR